jgi:hypothetical protein
MLPHASREMADTQQNVVASSYPPPTEPPPVQQTSTTVNNNTFCFATIDKVFYLVSSVLTTCFGLILGHHQVNLQNIKKEALFIQRIRRVE